MSRLNIKKHKYILIFIAAFVLISAGADIYYYGRMVAAKQDALVEGDIYMSDFKVFWTASHNMFLNITDHPEKQYPVYDKNEPFYHFRYSPFTAFILIPFGMIPLMSVSLAMWTIMSNAVFLWALLFLAKRFRDDFGIQGKFMPVICWVMFIGTLRFYLMNISIGQTDVFAAALLVLFLAAYVKGKEIICGVLIALLLQFKPSFAPILLYFLLTGKWRLVLGAVISFPVLLFLPALALGPARTVALLGDWREMLNMSVTSQLLNYKNQSITYGVGTLLLKLNSVKNAISVGNLFIMLGGLFTLNSYVELIGFGKRGKRRDHKEYKYFEVSLLVMISLLFSPISWVATFIALIIPLGMIVCFAVKNEERKVMCGALLAFFVLSILNTDLTKFIPLVNTWRFISIAFGTLLLAFAAVVAYQKKHPCSS